MRRVSILLVALLAVLTLGAQEPQEARSFVFEETEWDFGRINEQDGTISHTFRFRNEADHSVAIERVYTSCGCTSSSYSRRPIRSGEQSEFVVTFDPDGKGGRVDKVVTLVYDGGKGRTDLHIKGRVKARPRTLEEDYPFDLGGGLRADAIYKSYGNVPQGGSKSMTMALVNTTSEVMELEVMWLEQSGLLVVDVPRYLEAGGKAMATLTYLPGKGAEGHYGTMRDRFTVAVNGTDSGREIVTTGVAVDDLRKDKRLGGAVCSLSPVYHNFGSQRAGAVCTMEFTIANEGNQPLHIRAVEVRPGTSCDLKVGEVVPAGESITRTLTLRVTSEGFDSHFGGVLLVVNDPSKPTQELRVVAEVE